MRCAKEFEDRYGSVDVKLPATFTQRKLPMDKGDLPQTKKVAKWEHLQDLSVSTLDSDVSILIGNNVPDAYTPLEVRTGCPGSPHATRSVLGWIFVGKVNLKLTLKSTGVL